MTTEGTNKTTKITNAKTLVSAHTMTLEKLAKQYEEIQIKLVWDIDQIIGLETAVKELTEEVKYLSDFDAAADLLREYEQQLAAVPVEDINYAVEVARKYADTEMSDTDWSRQFSQLCNRVTAWLEDIEQFKEENDL